MRFLFTLSLLLTISLVTAQTQHKIIDDLVEAMAERNRVEDQYIGLIGTESQQYIRFDSLKKLASTEQLLSLLEHKNGVVKCYASMALADRNYANLTAVFKAFMDLSIGKTKLEPYVAVY